MFKSSKCVISSVEIVHNDNWRERPWWYSEFHQNHFQKWRWNCIFWCLHAVVLMVHSVKTNASSESKSELIRCIVLCRQINNGCWFALVKTTYWTTRVCFSSYFSRFLRISPFLDYAHLPFFNVFPDPTLNDFARKSSSYSAINRFRSSLLVHDMFFFVIDPLLKNFPIYPSVILNA